ncbi:universal stress protein [Natranaeroarchaeum sulfidigenes]|uniref:Nucleotide-binding protein, UspA family n=1 Tax=Natranaeroarchaeum sulfidigenes TaxID=2784880 RepID=A0A897MV04_9EURY|nr:universal stress protein [Natranaeroarchaeum sulfidigenes]QSG02006.1 Nucleotide-binding protein, UspA family [Natranaeroarchaeum sulfidigenes]
MTATLTQPTVLLPVDVDEPTTPPDALIDLLGPHRVVVLGYGMVPDQTPTEQYEAEFGDAARERIGAIVDEFEGENDVISTVVFTRDRSQTVDRVAEEHGVDAVVTPAEIDDRVDEVLVPIKGDPNIVRIVEFTGRLLDNGEASVTVFHVAESDADEARAEFLLRGACDKLREYGVDADRVGWKQERSGSAAKTIAATAEEYDLLVVGESEPSLRRRILGGVTGRISDRTNRPTLVVRRR